MGDIMDNFIEMVLALLAAFVLLGGSISGYIADTIILESQCESADKKEKK